jgi:hypothetical protein
MPQNIDTTKLLTSAMSLRYDRVVSQIEEVSNRLKRRLRYECSRAQLAREEMAQLGNAYLRYSDLQKELRERDARMEKLWALLGKGYVPSEDDVVSRTLEVSVPRDELRDQIPLWEFMELLLLDYGELREIEMLDVFTTLGFSTTGAAIASALKTHPKIFRIRADGRKKFISLRERGTKIHGVENSGATIGHIKRKSGQR